MQNSTSHKRLYINMTAFANKRQNIKLKLQRGLLKKIAHRGEVVSLNLLTF